MIDLTCNKRPTKQTTSSYSLHLADTTAGIDDISPSPQTTQTSGSKKDGRGFYLAIPQTGILNHCVSCASIDVVINQNTHTHTQNHTTFTINYLSNQILNFCKIVIEQEKHFIYKRTHALHAPIIFNI